MWYFSGAGVGWFSLCLFNQTYREFDIVVGLILFVAISACLLVRELKG